MSFRHYRRIKDRLCMIHTGHATAYLVQLNLLRPSLAAALPGVEIFIACKSQYAHWLGDDPKVIPEVEYDALKYEFAYTFHVAYDAIRKDHPVLSLLKDSGIAVRRCPAGQSAGRDAYVCPEGDYPTPSLTAAQVDRLCSVAAGRGFRPVVLGNGVNETALAVDRRVGGPERQSLVRQAGMVLGVECDMLFAAAGLGVPTALVPNGQGAELYRLLAGVPEVVGV